MNKKFFLTAGAITLAVFVLVLILSPKKNVSSPLSPSSTPAPRAELLDLSQEKRQQTMVYVEAIENKLPLYLENFQTSVGIDTTINLYRLDSDEAEVVRLEIYGLSYLNQDWDEKKNPNVTAFKESYAQAIKMLEGQNIDPQRLIFIYGDKEYVRQAAELWVSKLNLHP